MQPGPSPPGPNTSPGRTPAPKPVRALSVLLWISAALSSAVFAPFLTIVPLEQGGPEHVIRFSFCHTVVDLLLAVPTAPITRDRPWARRTAKVPPGPTGNHRRTGPGGRLPDSDRALRTSRSGRPFCGPVAEPVQNVRIEHAIFTFWSCATAAPPVIMRDMLHPRRRAYP